MSYATSIYSVGRYVAIESPMKIGKIVRNEYDRITVKLDTGDVKILSASEVKPAPSIYERMPQYDHSDIYRAVEAISLDALRFEFCSMTKTALAKKVGITPKKMESILDSGVIPSDVLPLIAECGIADISVDSVECWFLANDISLRS